MRQEASYEESNFPNLLRVNNNTGNVLPQEYFPFKKGMRGGERKQPGGFHAANGIRSRPHDVGNL